MRDIFSEPLWLLLRIFLLQVRRIDSLLTTRRVVVIAMHLISTHQTLHLVLNLSLHLGAHLLTILQVFQLVVLLLLTLNLRITQLYLYPKLLVLRLYFRY